MIWWNCLVYSLLITTHQANFNFRKLTQDINSRQPYVLLYNGERRNWRIPTTPKTELPMTISNCFLPINTITKRSIPDTAETLNSPLVIAMQNSPTIILLGSGQHPEKFFHVTCALLIKVAKFPVFWILRYHLARNMNVF